MSATVAEVLELTTVDEWNYVATADIPADAGTRGLPANALFDSFWLKDHKFLMTTDWPFQPSEEILETKLKNFDFNEINTKAVYYQETTAITASVTSNVLTLDWQRYSSYEKRLRIAAFILRIPPKFSGNRTKTGAITDPVKLESAVLLGTVQIVPERNEKSLQVMFIEQGSSYTATLVL